MLHIVEGQRLYCESLRVGSEIHRLIDEAERLRTEADRLDEKWLIAHKADPAAFPDTPDRDRSQRIMRSDADALAFTARSLGSVQQDLASEAVRILTLAGKDMNEASTSDRATIELALDAGSKKRILDRFRDEEALPS